MRSGIDGGFTFKQYVVLMDGEAGYVGVESAKEIDGEAANSIPHDGLLFNQGQIFLTDVAKIQTITDLIQLMP